MVYSTPLGTWRAPRSISISLQRAAYCKWVYRCFSTCRTCQVRRNVVLVATAEHPFCFVLSRFAFSTSYTMVFLIPAVPASSLRTISKWFGRVKKNTISGIYLNDYSVPSSKYIRFNTLIQTLTERPSELVKMGTIGKCGDLQIVVDSGISLSFVWFGLSLLGWLTQIRFAFIGSEQASGKSNWICVEFGYRFTLFPFLDFAQPSVVLR